jgi:nucleotide-binding universal stress UspA family protein
MFDRVIAGFDGFDGGRDAIALAAALRPKDLTILMVYGTQIMAQPQPSSADWDPLREDAERQVAAAAAGLGDEVKARAVSSTSAARALHEAAVDGDADLLVIGSAHHGSLGRLRLGDEGAAVLHGTPCAVAVAPKRLHAHGWRSGRIAVGYDGSDESRAALAGAADLAARHDAALVVCTAWEEPLYSAAAYPHVIREIAAEVQQRAKAVLDEAVATAGVPAEGRLLHGRPGPALRELSAELDLLVVGSRGYGTPLSVLMGSTSRRLVRGSRCPVLVTPRPALRRASSDVQAASGQEAS